MIFCKGAGGFAGGAQWHAEHGGGICMLGDWCLDSLAERVPAEWEDWWTGYDKQTGATAHEMGHTLGLPHPDLANPVTEEQDYPYTLMGAWWDWPTFPPNPADPESPLRGLHGWGENAYLWPVEDYNDHFLLDYRSAWFSHTLADIDRDGDVDLADFARVQACFDGGGPLSADCDDADLDHSHSVDLGDHNVFAAERTGPVLPR